MKKFRRPMERRGGDGPRTPRRRRDRRPGPRADGGTMERSRNRIRATDAEVLARLDDALHALWRYGRNMMLAWCEADAAIGVLVVPSYLPAQILAGAITGDAAAIERSRAVRELVDGRKQVEPGRMRALASLLGVRPRRIARGAAHVPQSRDVEELLRRYSVTRFDDRAVVLFDIVGFSLSDALGQLTQLISLAYSINVAHERLRRRVANIDIARTTTGDGYYVWNRRSGVEANIHLYHLMHLVLADNAIARAKSRPGLVPVLKTAYHIGSHYEFFQAEALRPTRYSYIVGDVTVQIARLVERALPGQVMVGEFNVTMPESENSETRVRMDTAAFIHRLQESLAVVHGMVLSGERVMSIKCYLTGPHDAAGGYGITRHLIADKHGRDHAAYNAKINIYRKQGAPIFLGLKESEIDAQAGRQSLREVIRRNRYDVTDRVFVADPRVVCEEVCAILRRLEPGADLGPVEKAFDVFGRLYAGTLPGYAGCETWYHDVQHSLDCALVMARMLDGHERGAADGRLGGHRARLGVIVALFHDAGYIRKSTDAEQHGAQFTLFHVRRSGDFLAEFLPTVGFAQEGPLAEQLVHFTGYEMALDKIQVQHPLDRRLGFMLGTADVLAQMSDRCYLEKCRDFLYPEFEICGLAGAPRPDGTKPLYASPEELLRRTPEFRDKIWTERMDGYFESVYRHAATHLGRRNLYLEAIEGQMRRLREVLRTNQIYEGLRRRADCVNAGPLRVILGLEPAGADVRAASRPSSYKLRTHAGAVDPRDYVPT